MTRINLARIFSLVLFTAFVSYVPPVKAQNSLRKEISDLKRANRSLEQRIRKLESALVVSSTQVKIRKLLIETDLSVGGNVSVGSNAAIGRNLSAGSNLSAGGSLSVGSNATIGRNLSVGGDIAGQKNLSAASNLSVGSNAAIGRNLSAGGDIAGQKNLAIGDNLTVKNIRLNGDIKIRNKITLNDRGIKSSGNFHIKTSGKLILKGSKITRN